MTSRAALIQALGMILAAGLFMTGYLYVHRYEYHPLPDGRPSWRYDRLTGSVSFYDWDDGTWYRPAPKKEIPPPAK